MGNFRRPFRPRWRRSIPFHLRPLRPLPAAHRRALEQLRRAHELMAQGEFEDAAIAFSDLADLAEERRNPRAAQLHLQAGRAWIEAGETKPGVERLGRGLTILLKTGRVVLFHRAGQRALEELRARGLTAEAEALEREFRASLASPASAFMPTGEQKKLPSKCPYCGGNVLADEVEWVNDHTPTCAYCGSPLELGG